jgi:hypothetical protein
MLDEADKTSAAHFLIVLLDCIEKWARKFPKNEMTGEPTEFVKSYKQL